MQKIVNERFQITPFHVLFLVNSIQIGVGIFGYQASLMKVAGNDSWIAVILAGTAVHIIVWIIFQICNRSKMDLIHLHKYLFGKWFGSLISLIWTIYFLAVGVIVLYSYFEVVQVWMFPKISPFWFVFSFLLMVFYTITGGFRIVTGICFFGVLIPFYLFLTFFFPVEYSNFQSLLPIWNHDIKEIGIGGFKMTLSYLGFSTILLYYPYIKAGEKSQKWAHIGVGLTTLIYLFIMIISIGYFSENQVVNQVWPTLTLWKIVEMPFVERFEYIGITSWVLMLLPNVCLFFWASSRGIKLIFNINQRKVLIFLLFFVLCLSFFLKGRERMETLNAWISNFGFVISFIYIPLLFILYLIISKIKGRSS
ncbi:spore germination protein (amino acid permease) [Bacillus pakistanensis]|uniref:Spore germination protein (Amino acid permease) n=1 Tax=Rossellomorea pakistanensis TaxID=992288 RepID=A0ABS2N864_9BACI|nr:GerAB/ArcD/ProY family transporter [Bacillus pakistanensis]MBM7584046.1 spore germination protein (amino acid permease) [Bacillus pakistanensis]